MKVLGYDYRIDRTQTVDSLSSMGRFQVRPQLIHIANDQADEQKISTLIHEVIEAINYHLKLDLEEKEVMGLEAGLYQVLKDAGVDLKPLLEVE